MPPPWAWTAWAGQTVDLGRDLTPAPALLFRVPEGEFGLLADGHFEVLFRKGRYTVPAGPAAASLLLGRRIRPGRDLSESWRFELMARDVNGPELEKTIIGWLRPAVRDSVESLGPGDSIEVRFVARSGRIASRCRCRVGGEAVQDYLLTEEAS